MKIPRLALLIITLLGLSALTAQAQEDCAQCDPYASSCAHSCYICGIYEQGGCVEESMTYTTCGEAGRPCIPVNCTPDWQEASRTNVGTYGHALFAYAGGWSYACDHHRVDSVTLHDDNECNTYEEYQTQTVCDDWVDAFKGWVPTYQDCCDGNTGPPYFLTDSTFTCNDYHSCT